MKISDIKEVETIGTVWDNDLNMEKQFSIEETIELTNNIIEKQAETWGEKHPAYKLYENMKGAFPTTGNVPEMDSIPHEEGMPNIEVTYLDVPQNK